MRIALCLTGLLGGLNGKSGEGKIIDPRNGLFWYKKNVIEGNNVDVFFHSWNDGGYDLIKLFNPKSHVIEDQMDFSHIDFKFYGAKSYEDLFLKEERLNKDYNIDPDDIIRLRGSIFRAHSKWASTFKVIRQKKEFEKKHRFKYDYVIISRFDIALTKKIDFKKLKKNKLYISARDINQGNLTRSFNDLVFMGDSLQIDLFASIYNNLDRYSVDPTLASFDHIKEYKINWEHYFDYNKDTFVLRWNQHLMKFSPQPYFFIKHNLREIKRKVLNV